MALHMQIELKPYHEKYLVKLMQWREQPSSVRHNPLRSITAEKMRAVLEAEGFDLQNITAFKSYRYFIEVDGEVCGVISLKEMNHMMNYAEIGYQVGEQFQGRGIATKAIGLLLDKIFSKTPLRRIMAYVHDENIASCRVLGKLGFQREGLLREHFIINGKTVNEILFALLKSEWRSQ